MYLFSSYMFLIKTVTNSHLQKKSDIIKSYFLVCFALFPVFITKPLICWACVKLNKKKKNVLKILIKIANPVKKQT